MTGPTSTVLKNDASSLNPSKRKKLLRLLCPFTEGKANLPTVFPIKPPPPPELCPTSAGETPGVSISSSVKFRPFKGKLFTSFVVTAVPSSAVEASRLAATASTVTLVVVAPTASVMSCVAVWLTKTSNSFSIAVEKPTLLTRSVYRPGIMSTKT